MDIRRRFFNIPSSSEGGIIANVGDVAYWNEKSISCISYKDYTSSLGTAIGIVIIPSGFTPDGSARIISLTPIDSDGNASTSYVNMVWDKSGNYSDTSLLNFTKVPTTDNMGSISSGGYGYLPSDKFTGDSSYIDNKSKYFGSSPMVVSSYLNEGPNPDYYSELSGNNVLSDFNGLSNTEVLVNLDSDYEAANAAYKYCDGVSNLQWYLPSMGELGYIMPRFNEINNVIVALGGVSLGSNYLWSSSEYSNNNAYRLSTYNGYIGYSSKTTNTYVRPIAKL